MAGKFWTIDTAYFLNDFQNETCVSWLYYFLQSVDLRSLNEATGVPSLSRELLYKLRVPTPHPQEQVKIAEVLLTLDRTIEQTEALIAKQQRIKTGLMQDLLTKGIDEHGNIRSEATHAFKDSPLGRIPAEWETNSLEELADFIVDCPHTTPHFLPEGILVVRTFNIKGGLFCGDSYYVSEDEYRERVSRLIPQPGDVVFTREAPVGEAFIVPHGTRLCLGQRTMLIRPDVEKMAPEYFLGLVYSEEQRIRFDQMVSGTTNPHLNVADVRNLTVKTPPLEEQKAISNAIESIHAAIKLAHESTQQLLALKRGLMHDLLTGERRVTPLLTQTDS